MSVNQFLNGKLNLIAGAGGGSVIADDNTFTGTTAEVEAAIADGLIEDDTIVFITDDVESGNGGEEITIEVLDTYDEIIANTELGKIAGAAGVKEGFEQIQDELSKINISTLDTYEEIMNNTEANKPTGALGIKEGFETVNENFGGLRFGIDGEGNYGYFKGDDTFVPFNSGGSAISKIIFANNTVQLYNSVQADIISITDDELQYGKILHMTFLSAAAGDILTNLIWSGLTVDEVLKNELHGGTQYYVAKVTVNSNTISLKADYAYNRNRSCNVHVDIYGYELTSNSSSTDEIEIVPLIPILTSNTGSDGGEVIYSNYNTDSEAPYKAFDGFDNTHWYSGTYSSGNPYIGYKFAVPTYVKNISLKCHGYTASNVTYTLTLYGSNDNASWDELGAVSFDATTTTNIEKEFNTSGNKAYVYYKLLCDNNNITTLSPGIKELQFYGYQMEALVPVMTDDNDKGYKATSGSVASDYGYRTYYAFDNNKDTHWYSGLAYSDWIGIELPEPTVVNHFTMVPRIINNVKCVKNYKVQALNGTQWVDLYAGVTTSSITDTIVSESINNKTAYTIYRINVVDTHDAGYSPSITELQFYTAPEGTASADTANDYSSMVSVMHYGSTTKNATGTYKCSKDTTAIITVAGHQYQGSGYIKINDTTIYSYDNSSHEITPFFEHVELKEGDIIDISLNSAAVAQQAYGIVCCIYHNGGIY